VINVLFVDLHVEGWINLPPLIVDDGDLAVSLDANRLKYPFNGNSQ
jgi:hypothetical protein